MGGEDVLGSVCGCIVEEEEYSVPPATRRREMRGRREDFVTSGSWRANRLSFSHLPLISDEIIIQGKEHVSAADQQQESPNYQGDEQDNTVSVDSSSNASASTQQSLHARWGLRLFHAARRA